MKAHSFTLGAAVGTLIAIAGTYVTRHTIDPAIAPATSPVFRTIATDSFEKTTLCKNIYKTICGKTGTTRDPTGIVHRDVEGELRVLRIYQEIFREHSDWSQEQINEELVRTIYTPKRRGQIESTFKRVLHLTEAFINRQPENVFTAQEKRQLKQRLRKTELQLPPPASLYADEPDLFSKNDVYYERLLNGQMRIRAGGAYLFTAKSWFNIIFTLAHEFAHSIDPCEVRSSGLSFPAYDRLTACFLRQGYIATRKTRSECGRNDQLSETFADWMAVQITADALKHFATEFHGSQLVSAAANSVRDLCEQEEGLNELDLELHPSPQVRIEKLFGDNPSVRELLGCKPAPELIYCGFD